MKRVVIGERVGGFYSSSMKPPSKDSQGDKGKGVLVTPSNDEKKKQHALEIERQRQVNSILRRKNGPPGLSKGNPSKHWCFETIEEIFLIGKFDYLRKPQRRVTMLRTLTLINLISR